MPMRRRSGGTAAPGRETISPSMAMVPSLGVSKTGDQAQQRRLAAAGRPQQGDEGSGIDIQVDAAQGPDAVKGFADRFDLHACHGRTSFGSQRANTDSAAAIASVVRTLRMATAAAAVVLPSSYRLKTITPRVS